MATGIRISGGDLRGRRIRVPDGLGVRPMRSRIRESLFAMLADRVDGATWVDVFAGSGALAIEALSRGARQALLLERDRKVIACIERNLSDLGVSDRARVVSVDAYRWRPDEPVDIVFLDPPFGDYTSADGSDPWELGWRLGSEALREGGVVGMEWPSREKPPEAPDHLEVFRERRYGDSTLGLWTRL